MAVIKPIYFDNTIGGYRIPVSGDTIDPSLISGGSGSVINTSVITFSSTDAAVELAVGDIVGVVSSTTGTYNDYSKCLATGRTNPFGLVFSKETSNGGVTYNYKAQLNGILDTSLVVGGTILLNNTGSLWVSNTGALSHTIPAPTVGGQTVRVGTILTATMLLVNLSVLAYH
jgi:hypothetical protein